MSAQQIYEDYVAHALAGSETVETFYPHANRDGKVWLLSHRSAPIVTEEDWARVRDDMIQTNMAIPVVICFGSAPIEHQFQYRMSREEAEQQVDLVLGVWPPKRLLCTANPNGWENCARRHSAKAAVPLAA